MLGEDLEWSSVELFQSWFIVAVSAANSAGTERIVLGDSDRSRAIRAKHYIESSKNSEKITINLKKNVDIHIHVSHVQNISPNTLNIK